MRAFGCRSPASSGWACIDLGDRQREGLAVDPDDDGCLEGQPGGQANGQPGSLARLGLELDRSLELRDLLRDDVHADAPSRDGVGCSTASRSRTGRSGCSAGRFRVARRGRCSPSLLAFAAIASWFRPRPSSWTAITRVLPSHRASSVIWPAAGLPAARRSGGLDAMRRRRCEPRAAAARRPCPARPGQARSPRRSW